MSKANLRTFIQNSTLSDEDKQMWQTVTNPFSDDDCQELLIMFETNDVGLAWLTENIKAKKEALVSGDADAMKKILADEKEKLSQVS